MNFAEYCTVGSPTGIVPDTVNEAEQAWLREGLDELSSSAAPATARTATVELWFAELADFASLLSSRVDMALLSISERQRAAAMSAPLLREHFLLSRILLRRILETRSGIAGAALEFTLGVHGKPGLGAADAASSDGALQFNLSHCRGAWLLGVARGMPIGVDVERPRRIENAQRLAERVFTIAERRALSAIDAQAPEERDAHFLRCWTRKEAILKALGSGFSQHAAALEVSAAASPQRVGVPGEGAGCAQVWSLTLPVPGFAACARVGEATLIDGSMMRLRWLRL